MSPKPSGLTTSPTCLYRTPLAHHEVPSLPSFVPGRSSQKQSISLPKALTTVSSLWAHKVLLRGPGPSSLEKQEALAGSSRLWGVLGAKYVEARVPWDSKRGYELRIPSSVHPSLISLYPVSLPGPSGRCLPGSLEPVLSEPDWAGAPGDSSSPPHLTGW